MEKIPEGNYIRCNGDRWSGQSRRVRNLVIAGIAVMAIGAAMSVWETHAEHALVLQAAQETPSIEGLNVVEITERGWERGEVVMSANSAMLSGKVLKTVMAGGHEEYTRFVDAVRAGGTQTMDERIERASTYIDGLYARRGRNWMEASETAGIMVVLFRSGDHHRRCGWRETLRALRQGRRTRSTRAPTRGRRAGPARSPRRHETVRSRCDESR